MTDLLVIKQARATIKHGIRQAIDLVREERSHLGARDAGTIEDQQVFREKDAQMNAYIAYLTALHENIL